MTPKRRETNKKAQSERRKRDKQTAESLGFTSVASLMRFLNDLSEKDLKKVKIVIDSLP